MDKRTYVRTDIDAGFIRPLGGVELTISCREDRQKVEMIQCIKSV